MKRDEKLEKLFKEINVKPKNLDQNIMSEIYKLVELERKERRKDTKSWIWTYVLLGILGICGLAYAVYFISFQVDLVIWIIGFGVLIPLIGDKILFPNGISELS